MERKTTIKAEDGQQQLLITREFDLPVELLFKAYVDAAIVEQWMGTRVLKLDSQQHGSYQFETSNAEGKVVFRANGVIHDCIPNERITRTFEMENTPFAAQLEVMTFKSLGEERSELNMHIIYQSVELRDQMMQIGFAPGLNMAHNRLQEIVSKLK